MRVVFIMLILLIFVVLLILAVLAKIALIINRDSWLAFWKQNKTVNIKNRSSFV